MFVVAFFLGFNSLCVLNKQPLRRCSLSIIISMIPKRILLQNYILSGVVAVVVVVSLLQPPDNYNATATTTLRTTHY